MFSAPLAYVCVLGIQVTGNQVTDTVRFNMRGNGMVSRTWSSLQIQATARSRPMPKPECGTPP